MKTRKFLKVLGLIALAGMILSACATPTAAPVAATAAPKQLTIAGVVFQDDQFMKSMVQGYKDAGAKYGITVITANTNNDQAKEAELIQTYISQKVDGIAIAPLSATASIANLKEAAGKGIKVAITNMNLQGDVLFLSGGYTSDDKTNGTIVGEQAAKFIAANITGDVNVGRVDFDDQLAEQSQARWGGFFAGLDKGGTKYKEVAHVSSHIQDDAVSKVTDMLTAHPEINVIWASNDGSTIGAAVAVKNAGKAGKVFVFGYDGGDQQTSMILSSDKILIAVIAQDPYQQGYKAVESLALTLLGKTNPDAGKITVVPGLYLDMKSANDWRTKNGLKTI
jgi:ABC-type sugar transport system substrate-binding protein